MTERTAATHDLDGVISQALAWRAAGKAVAIATVTQTWGSSPRPAGSKLAVNDASEFVGSVSGGCIEGAVIQEALEVMAGAPAHTIDFGVSDETAWEVGLACGGKVEVLVEPLGDELAGTLADLLDIRHHGETAALFTALDGSHRFNFVFGPRRETASAHRGIPGGVRFMTALGTAMERNEALVFEGGVGGERWLVEPHPRGLRLIIVGAVHAALPLAEMARLAAFAVTIVDPRRAFATEARFPGHPLVTRWPDEALRDLAPDQRTAVVTLTHDPKLDDPALVAALATDAFYVGCLGSTRTHDARRIRLAAQGLRPDQLHRLRGPVGLKIGARAPAEIAVSILAEIIGTLHRALA